MRRSAPTLGLSLVLKLDRRIRTSETIGRRIRLVNDNRLTLRQIAERASDRHDGARGRALGRIAEGLGLTLSYTTVDKILEGKYRSTPRPATLDALSELSGVPQADVYAAAGVPMPLAPLAEQLPPDADLLTPLQRDAVIAVVRQFAQANKALYSAQDQKELMGNAEHPAAKTELGSGPGVAAEGKKLLDVIKSPPGAVKKERPTADGKDKARGADTA